MKKLPIFYSSAVGCLSALALAGSASAAVVQAGSTFDTMLEGWTQNGHFQTYGQATASTGEGVLQGRLNSASPFDPQLNPNYGALSLAIGETWEAIEFRVRQLDDDGAGAPGAPAAFNFGSTLLAVTMPNDGGFKNFTGFNTANWSETTQADGWSVFTYDLATYLSDNSLSADGDISAIRFDPIGSPGNAGKWVEVDYFQVTAVPEPTSFVLILGGVGLLAGRRRRAVA